MFETEQIELYPKAEKNDKIALIDADTIAFAACSVCEYQYYDIHSGDDKWDININDALNHALEKIQQILDSTGCCDAELHFTSGMNFRYTVDPQYKSNRNNQRRPEGLRELKVLLLGEYPGSLNTHLEADDMVAYLKKRYPDKYIMCAIDKDILYSVPGRHFNYYSKLEAKGGAIMPKFIEVDEYDAKLYNYKQAIIGDPTDGIKGVPSLGKAKVEKLFRPNMTEFEMWETVVKAYKAKGMDMIDAMITMQLVSVHQVITDENGNPKLELFNPYTLEGVENGDSN